MDCPYTEIRLPDNMLIPISAIYVPANRQRSDLPEIEALAASIKTAGRLINPITVFCITLNESDEIRYQLIAGGRRLAAFKLLGRETIPATVYPEDITQIEYQTIELLENVSREDLPWQDRIRAEQAIHDLQPPGEQTLRTTSALLNLSQSIVSDDLKLLRMSAEHPRLLKAKNITEAKKQMRKLEEQEITAELVRRAEAKVAKTGLDQIRQDLCERYQVGDCLDGLRGLKSESFEFADIDPPYAVAFAGAQAAHHSANLAALAEFVEPSVAELMRTLPLVLEEVYRLLKPNSFALFWFDVNTYELMSELIRNSPFERGPAPGIWTKQKAARSNWPYLRMARDYEPFFYLTKGLPQLSRPGCSSIFDFRPNAGESCHPASKPIPLMESLLSTFALPSNRIIVPYLGSGNTLIAAENLGMRGTGFDLSKTYKNSFVARVQKWAPPAAQKKEDQLDD